ncbi:uncharacterized protein LOC120251356 [Dioscorea cayenensis subsp. rotundata]|uniref:Uncharacterized protein LOC120251356 n=1 Tax=Dioscorea cayennensis subsp. rotundata TaxID=55577 RepID=A0AB40AMB1_DIOCR|nr:uncharacterized protein LOC120251356 [Dioscorea cayenensis subsp. rotundata]
MIPPEPVNKKLSRKTMIRRREADEESRGYTNGKVCKKGVTMKCSVCGIAGHNKRYHGQGRNSNVGGQHSGQQSEAGLQNPMDNIDPQVLEKHFTLLDSLAMGHDHVPATSQQQISKEAMSQIINASCEGNSSQTIHAANTRRQKFDTIGGKSKTPDPTNIAPHMTLSIKGGKKIGPTDERPPVIKVQSRDKEDIQRNKDVDAPKKRKIWVPPRVTNTGSGTGNARGPA